MRANTYASIVSFEAFSLPYWHIDRIDAVAHSCDNPGNNQLHTFHCRCLQDGSEHHDPASPRDAAFSAIFFGCQKSNDSTKETTEVVDGGDYAFKFNAWIAKVGAK